MKLPIFAYGETVLRKKASEISPDYPGLELLISNMFETMYAAYGVGLAAPQIGLSIRLFVLDSRLPGKKDPTLLNFKKVFINPKILSESEESIVCNEGCLSIPNICADVRRKERILISYMNEKGEIYEESYSGRAAQIIQHEYDHLEGKLFIDQLSNLKKALLRGKLEKIARGAVQVDYKMKFPSASSQVASKKKR